MKSLLLLSLLFTSATPLSAQSDTTITYLDSDEKLCPQASAAKYAVQNKEKDHWKKVVFDVLDDKPVYGAYYSDPACTLFDGSYSAFNKNQKVIINGRYVKNKKAGVWEGFSDEGKLIDSAYYKDGFIYGTALAWYTDGSVRDSLFYENNGNGTGRTYWPDGKPKESGNFIAGKKNGLWTYNYKSGIKCQEVIYEADSALSFTCYDPNGRVQSKNCYYEKEAAFRGGDKAWMKYLIDKLSAVSLPKIYNEGKIYGTVYIQFVVDSGGKITDVKTVKSIAPELDELAISIIQQSPHWEPAVQFNRNVRAYRKQPITFPKVQ